MKKTCCICFKIQKDDHFSKMTDKESILMCLRPPPEPLTKLLNMCKSCMNILVSTFPSL